MAKLTILNPEFGEQSCILPHGKITVGRDPQNMLVIDHASISSRHCDFLFENREFIVRECGSRNGTFVEGVRVQSQNEVQEGQTITLGKIDLRLEVDVGTTTHAKSASPVPSDRARHTHEAFHQVFNRIGDPISESMTIQISKIREDAPAPTFNIPEIESAPRQSLWLRLIFAFILLGAAVFIVTRFLRGS